MKILLEIIGSIFSVIAVFITFAALLCTPFYIGLMVIWHHFPLQQMLLVGGGVVVVLLGVAWVLNKIGVSIRSTRCGT